MIPPRARRHAGRLQGDRAELGQHLLRRGGSGAAGEHLVSVLIVVTYPDEPRAAEVLAVVHRLRAAAPAGVEDSAVVVRHLDSALTLYLSHDLSGAAAPRRALWEALVALLVPATPEAPQGDLGAALQRLEALGLPEAFAVRLLAGLAPASSAVWLVVDDGVLAGVLTQLQVFGGTMLTAPLAA